MVKDFLDSIKTSNQVQATERTLEKPSQTNATTNYKTCRKTINSKKSHIKSSLNVEELPQTSKGNRKLRDNDKPAIPTKVKSGSWKRSEKSIVPFNNMTSKKHKNLRKKSPNWLKFPNSKGKILETSGKESASACKPGTLYSDVLFGAGCSNLVKIKNITPRSGRNAETAQRMLTKALFKFNGNNDVMETSDNKEIEVKGNLFPALQKGDKITKPLLTNIPDSKEQLTTTCSTSCKKIVEPQESEDVVILSDFKDLSLANTDLSNSKPLEENCHHFNGKIETEAGPSYSNSSSIDRQYSVASITNIPKWNFMTAETSAEAFPKFMCQFDDEHYLKAEKMAWLGLKLALGNTGSYDKGKF